MRFSGTASWRVELGNNPLVDGALWIRDVERLPVADDPLVPGPVDLDHPPAPTSTSDESLAADWLGWWHSLVDPTRPGAPADELAYGSPDPLGLAPYPALAALVTRRWSEARRWQNARGQRRAPSMTVNQVVSDVSRTLGRPVAPFAVEFLVLPVRELEIRAVSPVRFLVPEPAVDGPGWTDWLRDLFTRLA